MDIHMHSREPQSTEHDRLLRFRRGRTLAAVTSTVLALGGCNIQIGGDEPQPLSSAPPVTSAATTALRPSPGEPSATASTTHPPVTTECSWVNLEPAPTDPVRRQEQLDLLTKLGPGEARLSLSNLGVAKELLEDAWGDPALTDRFVLAARAADPISPESPMTLEQFDSLAVPPPLPCNERFLDKPTAIAHRQDVQEVVAFMGSGFASRGNTVIQAAWNTFREGFEARLDAEAGR